MFNNFKKKPATALRSALCAAGLCAAFASGPGRCAELPQAAATQSAAAAAADNMTLPAFVRKVLVLNNVIGAQRINQQVSEEEVVKANAIFEPLGKLSLNRTGLIQKNSAEEDLIRQSLGIYERRSSTFDAGVSMLGSTGATIEAKVGLDATRSNLQVVADRPKEFKALYDVSVTQPLARDRGSDVTRAKVRMAELDATAAGHSTREITTSVISDAISAYLDLGLAQQRDQLWTEGTRTVERLLGEAKMLYEQGRLAETALLDVENSLLRYRVGASESRQRLVEAMNKVRTLLQVAADQQSAPLVAADPLPPVLAPDATFANSMGLAVQNRPDYLSRKATVEREGVRIVYAENQTLPRIDLVASYGINGLDYQADKAFGSLRHQDFPSWKVGFQAVIPLGGNQRAGAELRSARMGKEKALLDLKAVETAMANDIDNSLVALGNGYERWQMYRRVLDAEGRQLDTERRLLAAGRSDMRNVLSREEGLIRTRTAVLEQTVAFAKAKMALAVAQGTLLDAFVDSNRSERTHAQ